MELFALEGPKSKELLSYRGRVLVHENRQDLEWLFPGIRIVPVNEKLGRPMHSLRKHPELAHQRWPLRRGDFR